MNLKILLIKEKINNMVKVKKYGAEWCAPCKATTINLKDSGVEFEEIDIDKNEDVIEEKGIVNIPYLEFYKDNDTIPYATHKGLMTKEDILKTIENGKS